MNCYLRSATSTVKILPIVCKTHVIAHTGGQVNWLANHLGRYVYRRIAPSDGGCDHARLAGRAWTFSRCPSAGRSTVHTHYCSNEELQCDMWLCTTMCSPRLYYVIECFIAVRRTVYCERSCSCLMPYCHDSRAMQSGRHRLKFDLWYFLTNRLCIVWVKNTNDIARS